MMDIQAVAVAMGATPSTKNVTVLTFGPNREITLEELQQLDDRIAIQRLLSLAVTGPATR